MATNSTDQDVIQTIVEVHNVTDNQDTQDSGVFLFDKWIKDNGFLRKTSKILRDEDIVTPAVITSMNVQELRKLGVTYGQATLLVAAAAKLLPPAQPPVATQTASMTVSNTPDIPAPMNSDIGAQCATLAAAGKQYDQLFGVGSSASMLPDPETRVNPTQRVSNLDAGLNFGCLVNHADSYSRSVDKSSSCKAVGANDPRSILTVKSSTRKACHINQFLGERAKERRQQRRRDLVVTTSEDGVDKLTVHNNDKHPYAGISIDEWGAANIRLMHHLLQTGDLARPDIEFYLAYTVSVFEMAQVYEWSSILNFDHQYREQQAQLDFQWGEISPLLQMQLLVPRQRQNHNRASSDVWRSQRGGTPGHLPPRGREQCRLFKVNNGVCPFGDSCKYLHVSDTAPASMASSSTTSKNGERSAPIPRP